MIENKLKAMLALGIAGICVSGCSLTLPVRGQSVTGDETFSGSATGYMNGGGTLSLVSSKGRTCTGSFVYISGRQGSGTFTCNNGESGPFEFVSTGTSGTGTGIVGGRRFTFTFG